MSEIKELSAKVLEIAGQIQRGEMSPLDATLAVSYRELQELAAKVGVAIPRTYLNRDEIRDFPIVVKQAAELGGVCYVNSLEELSRIDLTGAVAQEYIRGQGYGFF